MKLINKSTIRTCQRLLKKESLEKALKKWPDTNKLNKNLLIFKRKANKIKDMMVHGRSSGHILVNLKMIKAWCQKIALSVLSKVTPLMQLMTLLELNWEQPSFRLWLVMFQLSCKAWINIMGNTIIKLHIIHVGEEWLLNLYNCRTMNLDN